MSTSDLPQITFDSTSHVRILPQTDLQHTEDLSSECTKFISQISDFKTKVGELVSTLVTNGEKIEKSKLKAIGQRNKLASENDDRVRQEIALKSAIGEKRLELERLKVQYSSLEKVEGEQGGMIEKLQNQ